jgi:hypothetical protein
MGKHPDRVIPPIPGPDLRPPRRELREGDIVTSGARRYLWRDEVLQAEPANEIRISQDEINRVTEQLDVYFGA